MLTVAVDNGWDVFPYREVNNIPATPTLPWCYLGDTWTKLIPIGNTATSNGYYVVTDVTVGRRSFCLHTFVIFFRRIKCLRFSQNAHIFKFHYTGEGGILYPIPRAPFPHPTSLNFISKILHFTMQINAYLEGTTMNTEINERPLKNIAMHWNIRHRWFQRAPISFSLALSRCKHWPVLSVCCIAFFSWHCYIRPST